MVETKPCPIKSPSIRKTFSLGALDWPDHMSLSQCQPTKNNSNRKQWLGRDHLVLSEQTPESRENGDPQHCPNGSCPGVRLLAKAMRKTSGTKVIQTYLKKGFVEF
jgi:hypothetical protein